ncbi:MAG: LamG-like jellyroll fold domain-containing protein, partial [Lentisphaerota bacterium]
IPYISAANSVTTRIYHVSSGNTAHRTWIDYVALEQSTTGGQGPRGATGATGATGAQGVNTGTTSTFIISDTTNSTSTTTGALQVAGGVGVGGNVYVGGNLYVSSGTVNILAYDPNILYVSSSIGNDTTGDGRRISSAYATIKKALSVSTSGNVINIAAGIYSEIFPLTVPQGVTIAGAGIRATTINPTVGTNTLTAVYLNGETTVNDLTISGFYKPGYAFQFATGANITTRSPYVQRVSVITRGSVTSGSDPYGFAQADAGNGAYLDASVLNAGSLEPAMLWNEVTFVVPNATGLYATNGARAELIDTFVYFADKAVNAVSGSTGFAGVGQTRLKLGTVTTGTFTAGDKIVYKSSTGTVITSGTIASVVGSYVYLNGPVWGFETAVNRTAKITTAYGTAALSTAQKKFGTSSLLLNGTTDFALVPTTTDFLFANSNLTIELWVYRAGGTGVNQVLLDFRTASTQVALALYLSTTYVPTLQVNGSAVIVGGAAVSLNTWTHIAVSKSGTSTKLFVNGTQSGSTYTDNNSYIQGPLSIGANYAQASWFNGYIDDLRVSNVARYTTTFTAPTSELTNDVSTLLMLHFNGSNGSTSISDDYLVLQNISSVGASPAAASSIVLADYHQFGAELRFIASAAHYGNTAVTANGTGTDIKLISYNMSYIGAGKDITDDASLTVQANEVIQLNNGKIYYQTIDQSGDFRVGSSFIVNQRTGNVNFGNAQVNLSSLNQLIITDGVNNTNIYPTYISVGDLVFSGDTIASQGGNLTINAGGGATTLNNNTLISGSATISGVTTVTNVTNSTSTTTGALTVAGGVGISGNLNVGGTVTVAQPIISDAAATAVGTNIVVLDSFAITKYRAAKYFISVNNTSTLQYQATEILLVQDGTNSSIEQTSVFATTDNIITFTSIIIGSIVYLRGIGTSANNTVKVQATYITV